jgi:hypothetical protein
MSVPFARSMQPRLAPSCIVVQEHKNTKTQAFPHSLEEFLARVLLGNPASGVPIPGNKGMKLRLSEVAELARLEPLQYLLEGPRVNGGSAGEGMVHGNDCE